MSGKKGYVPPASVAKAAARGLEYRKRAGGKGGLDVKQASAQGIGSGVQRATNLKNRDAISADTVRRMKAFFDRHAKNKDVAAGKEPWEDRGHVAWLLWGGDPGRKWANKIVASLDESVSGLVEELRAALDEEPRRRTPPQVKRCVAKVADKVQDTSRAFAICVAQMQKSGQIKPGTMQLTKKGKKRARSKAAKKDYRTMVDKYEKALKRESVVPDMKALLESNYDADKVAADLLAVCPPNRMNHCKRALEVVLPAYAGGEDIYNADYKDAKDTLGRVIDDAWNDHPAWDETYKAYLLNLESEIKHTENGLRDLESRLRVWKKTAD